MSRKILTLVPEFYSSFKNKTLNIFAAVKEHTFEGHTEKYTSYYIDKEDSNYKSIMDQAKNDDITIRFWLPNSLGTMDYRCDRLNFSVTKDGLITSIYIG